MRFKIGDKVRVKEDTVGSSKNRIGKVCAVKNKGHVTAYKKYGQIKYSTASVDYVTVELFDCGRRWFFRADEVEHVYSNIESNKEFKKLWDFLTNEE